MAKTALLVGVSDYPSRLPGALNDVVQWETLVSSTFGFHATKCVNAEATRDKIQTSFQALLTSATPGDALLFYFSGHGTWTRANGQSAQGIVAYSNASPSRADVIFDYEIAKWISDSLPRGARLTLMLDCCHSQGIGSMERLDFRATVRFIVVADSPNVERPPIPDNGESFFTLYAVRDMNTREPLILAATDRAGVAYEDDDPRGIPRGVFSNSLAWIVSTSSGITHNDAMVADVRLVNQIHPDQTPRMNGPRLKQKFLS